MRRTSSIFILAALSIGLVSMTGCTVRGGVAVEEAPPPEGTVYVETAPPAEQVEVVPARPAGEHVWIKGHWQWEGRWVWIGGRWEAHRGAGWRWEEGHWVRNARGHYWVEGHWRR